MARQIRRFGPFIVVFAVVFGISALFLTPPESAAAATYTDPWWSNTSSSPECAACAGCGCPWPDEWSPEGVSYRTGDMIRSFDLFTTPKMNGHNHFGLLWRATIDGATQVGNGMVLSFEHTVEENIINAGDPDAYGGTEVYWRDGCGAYRSYKLKRRKKHTAEGWDEGGFGIPIT